MFEVRDNGNGGYQLSFTTGNVILTDEGNGRVQLQVEGMVNQASRVGLPALPQMSRLLVLPRGSAVHLERWQEAGSRRMQMEGSRMLSPWKGATVKDGLPVPVEPDKEVYATDAWARVADPVRVENLGTMGDWQLFRITVSPAAYNPVAGEIILTTALTATLTTTTSSLITPPTAFPERYLIVSRPGFQEGLQPFVRWKRQEGYEVKEIYADTNWRDSIKAMIAAEFDSRYPDRWPRYLLLVGDAAQIQSFPGNVHLPEVESHMTDLYYAEHTGDYLPDVLMGRWPVNDTAELGAVVRKTLRYEQGTDLDSAQLRRLLLVAGNESEAPAPVTTNGQVNYLKHEVHRHHPGMDTVCYYNPASANQVSSILGAMRQGAAMLNYTAHCNVGGWSSPSVSFSSIDSLDNRQPMLWVNNCCKSNTFTGTGFGEQLLRKPDGGAVGVIGATNSTLWSEDYYWAVGPKYPLTLAPVYDSTRLGAFDRLWAFDLSAGEMVMAGNLSVAAFGSTFDNYYWEIYCLLGDPSLHPWIDVPQNLELHATNAVHDGDATLHLGGTPGAVVSAMQGDNLLGVGVMGADGQLTLGLNSCLDANPLVVTATAVGHKPLIDTLQVEAVVGVGVALREVAVTDSTVSCRVENIGTMPLYGLRFEMNQPNADSTVDALLTEQQSLLDTLLPHQSRQLTVPVEITVVGQWPEWRAQLSVWDSIEGMLCSLTLRHDMDVSYPEATYRLLENDGEEAHRLLPNHSYQLETAVQGVSDSVSLTVTALPTLDTLFHTSPFVSLSSPFLTPDTLTHVHIESVLRMGNHRTVDDLFLVGGHRTDSFEEGFFSYPWQQSPNSWVIDSSVSFHGRFCARSGAIRDEQYSDLAIEVWMPQADTLSFMLSTSTEIRYDKFQFSVDGRLWGYEQWGESQWEKREYLIPAGRHTLRWRYVKDASGSAGSDCIWIDDVRLPLALWDSAYGWFDNIGSLGIKHPDTPNAVVRLYPNPTTGWVTVEGAGRLRVIDLYGREVLSTYNNELATYNLSHLPDGLYFLQMASSGSITTQKLIIKH